MSDYNVIVVGGGPAGLMTAKSCAERGLKVCILEKDAEIGSPKRCAEGVSIRGFERAGLKPNPRFIAAKIDGATLWSPEGKEVPMMGGDASGYVLERKIFEKFLAKDAIEAGSDCKVRTTVTDLMFEDGKVSGVKANCMGDILELTADVVVGADGIESKVGKIAGIKTINVLKDYISGFQYEMAGVKNLDMRKIHLWFGNEVAPKGYLWVFPKGDSLANVGIGIIGTANEQKSAREHLDGFIMEHPEFFRDAAPVEVNSGGVPVSGMISDSFVKDNFLLVGDSAQMVNPIHGGGMSTNLYAGMIAGRVIAEAINSGDTSKEKLFEYEKEWRATDGLRMGKLLKLRLFLEQLNDKDFEYFADALTGEDLMNMQKGKVKFMFKMLIKHPRLLNLARKYLTGF